MEQKKLKAKIELTAVLGEYFELLQNYENQGIGYLGDLICKELEQAETPKELGEVYTYLAEYSYLIKRATEDRQGLLLDMPCERLEVLIDN